MTDSDPNSSSLFDEDPGPVTQEDPGTPELGEEHGYLRETGQAVGDDGSVVPIIGGLPAVEGSSWDIGAPVEDRGAGLAEDLGGTPDA